MSRDPKVKLRPMLKVLLIQPRNWKLSLRTSGEGSRNELTHSLSGCACITHLYSPYVLDLVVFDIVTLNSCISLVEKSEFITLAFMDEPSG